MFVFYNVIEFLAIFWGGYLLNMKTKLKLWEVAVTLIVLGCIFVFIGVMLAGHGLI